MTANAWLQFGLYVGLLLAFSWPLGAFMTRVYTMDRATGWLRPLGALERLIYRVSRVDAERETNWKDYAKAMLLFNGLGLVLVYGLQRLQPLLPLNPMHLGAVSADSSFNTAVSFVTNTNWQGYGGESTMSYFTQMLGLTVQNFLSAATGMAIAVALIRGFARRQTDRIGNFWQDMTRSTVYVLLPLSFVVALALVSQGTVQTLAPYPHAMLVEPNQGSGSAAVSEQIIAVGPAASQIAIKQLGTNGGGFFNANSSHPFENPTPLSNLIEMLAILGIGAAFCHVFGRMAGDRRQGIALLAVMTILFVGFCLLAIRSEGVGNPRLDARGTVSAATATQAGGNMEGKETRFGIVNSAIWATATSAASNGSVNSMHDSFTPLGGLVPMVLIQLGEVVFGGVGSGLYGMLAFAIVAVFIAGLMVGRTPEYLGKKIGSYEMKMVSLVILVTPLLVLSGTAIACVVGAGKSGISNAGAHGFSEILYAFSSAANNNGSAFAGLSANTPFYNVALGLAIFFGRYFIAVPILALAGSLAMKKTVPAGAGTLPTHGPLFVTLLSSVVLVVGALTFLPALVLGPIVEHLILR
jgi:potassium-transporting ATPase potassium-binding subunit